MLRKIKRKLRRIKKLVYYPLKSVLVEKYHFKEKEAKALSDFLMPMLEYYPEKRASARELLRHPWLTMPPNYDYLMSEAEIFRMNMKENLFGINGMNFSLFAGDPVDLLSGAFTYEFKAERAS